MVFLLAPATVVLMMMVLVALAAQETARRRRKQQQYHRRTSETPSSSSDDLEITKPALPSPPGPTPIPFLGNLLDLAKYKECPFEAFGVLEEKYGPVFSLKMGSYPAVVVNTVDTIKEVLVTKGSKFDSRADIHRFGLYFGGDRQQSLALCDWSDIQQRRINLIRSYLSFRGNDDFNASIQANIDDEMTVLTREIDQRLNKSLKIKELLSLCAMNIHSGYMCSQKFQYKDKEFQNMVKDFDFLFDDINNGHPTDFLPGLVPFFSSYMNKIKKKTSNIRKFLVERICKEKYDRFTQDPSKVNDLVDACFVQMNCQDEEKWSWDCVLYLVEDLLGGSSAISNIIMRYLAYIISNPDVLQTLRNEIETHIGDRSPCMEDRQSMVYSQAVLYEVLRLTSSPIVPHVASQPATISGYHIEKGSIVFLNNFKLNTCPKLWDNPLEFRPERFIVDGELKKPAHFMPFSTGKRMCVGSKLVANVAFFVTTTLLQRYDIRPAGSSKFNLPKGKLSLDWNPFELVFTPRQ